MPRITKEVTHDLIQFAKSLKVYADVKHPRAKSAFEFCRQMHSPKLAKKNPGFEVDMVYNEKLETPKLVAKFSDGSTWETNTEEYKAKELRDLFWERAMKVEEAAEAVGNDNISSGEILDKYFLS